MKRLMLVEAVTGSVAAGNNLNVYKEDIILSLTDDDSKDLKVQL